MIMVFLAVEMAVISGQFTSSSCKTSAAGPAVLTAGTAPGSGEGGYALTETVSFTIARTCSSVMCRDFAMSSIEAPFA